MPHVLPEIYVRRVGMDARRAYLFAGPLRFPCALGRSGRVRSKREGDGATPIASMPVRRLWWRPDKVKRPRTSLPTRPISALDLWCDAPADRNYNRHIRAPYRASHEKMLRADDMYDLVVELGWNDRPRIRGRGSAIFMHVARPGFRPTEGCIALRRRDLEKLLCWIGPGTRVVVS